jgi:hypothetical protein
MARDLKAKIRLEADTKQADKALKNSTQEIGRMEKASKNLGAAFGKLGPAFKALSVAVLAGAAAFAKIISLANEQETAVRQLDSAIGNLTGANRALSLALQEQANSLSEVTNASDEEILAVQARIGLFVKEEEQIKALTIASIDFAAAKDKNATEVADALVRSIVTENNALLEQGIIITGAAGSVERFNSALSALSVTQGASAALADTTAGKFKLLADAFSDLLQEIGLVATKQDGFNGLIDSATDAIRKATRSVNDYIFAIKNLNDTVRAYLDDTLPDWLDFIFQVQGASEELRKEWEKDQRELAKLQKEMDAAAIVAAELARETRLDAAAAAVFAERNRELTETIEEQAPAFDLTRQEATDYTLQLEAAREQANLLIREEERLTAAVVSGAQARAAARAQERAGLQGSGGSLIGNELINLTPGLSGGVFFQPGSVRVQQNGSAGPGP